MRSAYLRFLLLALCLAAAPRLSAGDSEADPRILEVEPDVFCVTHAYPWPSNSLVAVMEDGEILMIDTPYTPEATRKVLAWIEGKFGQRRITAINTHFHVDRLGGNAALVERGIPVYGSELTIRAIRELGRASIRWTEAAAVDPGQKRYYSSFDYVEPTRVFDSRNGLTLTFGGELVKVAFLGVGHSVDNLFVFLPRKRLIFGGCAILSLAATRPGNATDGDVEEWKNTLRRMDTEGYELVIPGHGDAGRVELIRHTLEVLEGR